MKLLASIRNGVLIECMMIEISIHSDDHNFSIILITKSSSKCSNNDSLAVTSGHLDDVVLLQHM